MPLIGYNVAVTEQTDSYPYLFYGYRPADWYEGGNNGYRIDLRFATEPDEEHKRLAEDAFTKAAKGAAALAYDGDPWQWSGAWATLMCGDRQYKGGFFSYDELWRELARAVDAAHRVAPLGEVVNRNAWAYRDDDQWTEWSVTRQARPGTPAPR